MLETLAIGAFVLGYLGISLEHQIKINKSAIALFIGGLLWCLVALTGIEHLTEGLVHQGVEIFEIVVFLLSAMSLVEILAHYRLFDIIRGKLFALGLSEQKQFIVVMTITFFLSAVIDNLTTTIVMIQIARRFFKLPNLLVAVAAIVVAANAGGAFSPLGDVTTIMLWLAGKFSATEIILKGFLPSVAIAFTALLLFYPKIKPSEYDSTTEIVTKLSKSERLVIILTFSSFAFPIVMSFVGLPPYLGLLIGLGLVWITVDLFKVVSGRETHLTASIEKLLQKTDISSIQFFIGILLAVGALHALGILEHLSTFVYGSNPESMRLITGHVFLGMLSAILDNVPLTAMAINMLTSDLTSYWILLAITVGTGGSLLVIGSAAGVIAMGMVHELTFVKYIKIAFIPALVSFLVGVGVWYVQFLIFG